ncbi:efflux RND transporter permease subunit [Thermopirellula anaerolimosa]
MNREGYEPALSSVGSRFSFRLASFLVARRWVLLALGTLLFAASLMPAMRLQFDRSLERLFRPGDPDLAALQKIRQVFSAGDMILVVYRDPDLLAGDAGGLERLREIARTFREIPGVYDVWSLDQPIGDEIVDPHSDLAARMRRLFEGYTHNRRGDISGLSVLLRPQDSAGRSRDDTVAEVRRVAATLPNGMMAGEPVLTAEGFRYIAEDGARLGWASSLLLAAVMLLVTGRPRFVLVALAVVQVAVFGTQASLVMLRLHVSWVSSVLTAVITVVGIGAVMHILVRFQEKLRAARTEEEALTAALAELIRPVFWVLVTDAIGFGALSASRVLPIQEFSWMMVLAVIWVGIAAVLFVPGLILFPRPRRYFVPDLAPSTVPTRSARTLDRVLQALLGGATRHPWVSALFILTISTAGALGWMRLRVETDFTRNFRERSEVAQSYDFIEKELGGAGVWDILLPAPEYLSWPYLRRVQKLEDRLRREVTVTTPSGTTPGLTKVLSLIDAVAAAAPRPLEEIRSNLVRDGVIRVGMNLIRRRMPSLYEALYGPDPTAPRPEYWYRIMLRSQERLSATAKQAIIADVRRICREEFPGGTEFESAREPVVGGYYVLLARLVESVIEDQNKSLALAIAGVFLTMLIVSRSILTATASLLANLLPVAAVLGTLGWLGIHANMGSAMMAAVALGLSVDGTIHYLFVRDAALALGKKHDEALRAAQSVVGPAAVLATLALTAGFATMILSEFIPTVHFGLLLSLTMLGGMLSNLYVLPWMLTLLHRLTRPNRRKARSTISRESVPAAIGPS